MAAGSALKSPWKTTIAKTTLVDRRPALSRNRDVAKIRSIDTSYDLSKWEGSRRLPTSRSQSEDGEIGMWYAVDLQELKHLAILHRFKATL